MKFGTDVQHLRKMWLTFERSRSKFKVKTAVLKIRTGGRTPPFRDPRPGGLTYAQGSRVTCGKKFVLVFFKYFQTICEDIRA